MRVGKVKNFRLFFVLLCEPSVHVCVEGHTRLLEVKHFLKLEIKKLSSHDHIVFLGGYGV